MKSEMTKHEALLKMLMDMTEEERRIHFQEETLHMEEAHMQALVYEVQLDNQLIHYYESTGDEEGVAPILRRQKIKLFRQIKERRVKIQWERRKLKQMMMQSEKSGKPSESLSLSKS